MTFGQLISILKARWVASLLVFASVVTLVVVWSLLTPRQYTASASVVVDIKSPDPIAGGVAAGGLGPGYMTTQLDVLQSERVALRALRTLGLHENARMRAQWQEATGGAGDYEAWLAELLQKRLEVKPSRDSSVISLGYTSPDSQFSAQMANAFMQSYIDTTLDLKVEPAKRYNSFFDERAKQTREALEQVQKRLSAYQQEKGIIATDERLDVENARLAELSTQLVALQAVAAESRGRQGQAGANGDRMEEVLTNPTIVDLQANLSRQEGRMYELKERLGSNHPQVQELQASIGQLQARIRSETRRVAGSLSINDNVNQSRLTQLRAALDEQRAKVLRLKGQRDEVAVLLRDVESAQRAYDAVLERVNQSSMESQNTQTNVSVLKRATAPPFPSSPRVLLNTAVAVVLGALLAVAAAVVRELMDRRLRSETDVIEVLKQPLLVVMPRTLRHDVRGRLRLGLMKAQLVKSLPPTAA